MFTLKSEALHYSTTPSWTACLRWRGKSSTHPVATSKNLFETFGSNSARQETTYMHPFVLPLSCQGMKRAIKQITSTALSVHARYPMHSYNWRRALRIRFEEFRVEVHPRWSVPGHCWFGLRSARAAVLLLIFQLSAADCEKGNAIGNSFQLWRRFAK